MARRLVALLVVVLAGVLAMRGSIVPLALLLTGAFLACILASGVALGELPSARRERALRTGGWGLGIMFALTLLAFLSSATDWTHALWSVQFPLGLLFAGSGVLLVRVWMDDRREHPALYRGWNGAVLALVGCLVLGGLPLLLAASPVEPFPTGRGASAALPPLLEVAQFGLGGDVPALMIPEAADQLQRGLGHPPRYVTVGVAATQFAAWAWILFVALAIAGSTLPAGKVRRCFLLTSPLALALAVSAVVANHAFLYDAVWDNEPWFVKAYGPTLVIAALATAAMFGLLRRDQGGEVTASPS